MMMDDSLFAQPHFCPGGFPVPEANPVRWWGCDLNPQAVTITESRLAVETAPLEGLAV